MYNITLGDIDIGQQVSHRGINFDFKEKTLQIRSSTHDKFEKRLQCNQGTWGEWRSLFSMLTYGAQILGVPLCEFFHINKFWAKHTDVNPKLSIQLWEATEDEFQRVAAVVLANQKVSPAVIHNTGCILFTDARLDDEGAIIAGILICEGTGHHLMFTRKLNDFDSDINVLEAYALEYALHIWSTQLKHTCTTYLTDNTATLATLEHMHSRSYKLNAVVGHVYNQLMAMDTQLLLMWIPSAHNPADAPTRGDPFTHDHLNVLSWATQNSLRSSDLVEEGKYSFPLLYTNSMSHWCGKE